jgi:hypothetical protein
MMRRSQHKASQIVPAVQNTILEMTVCSLLYCQRSMLSSRIQRPAACSASRPTRWGGQLAFVGLEERAEDVEHRLVLEKPAVPATN